MRLLMQPRLLDDIIDDRVMGRLLADNANIAYGLLTDMGFVLHVELVNVGRLGEYAGDSFYNARHGCG